MKLVKDTVAEIRRFHEVQATDGQEEDFARAEDALEYLRLAEARCGSRQRCTSVDLAVDVKQVFHERHVPRRG